MSLDGYQKWAAKERELDLEGLMPSHSMDDADDVDPYNTVLFADIRSLLFPPADHEDELFLHVCLQLLGLYIPGLSDALLTQGTALGMDSTWSYPASASPDFIAPFLGFSSAAAVSQSAVWSSVDGLIMGRERQMGSGWGPVKEWGYGTMPGGLLCGHGTHGKGRMWEEEDITRWGVNVSVLR